MSARDDQTPFQSPRELQGLPAQGGSELREGAPGSFALVIAFGDLQRGLRSPSSQRLECNAKE